jgi:hypothetical protein
MESETELIQKKAIKKYGVNFTNEYFYETIAMDEKFIKMFSKIVNKHLDDQLKIIIKHRSRDTLTNKWILKHLYLPL